MPRNTQSSSNAAVLDQPAEVGSADASAVGGGQKANPDATTQGRVTGVRAPVAGRNGDGAGDRNGERNGGRPQGDELGVPPRPPLQIGSPLVEARDVSVFYGQFEAIKKVSLAIPANNVVAFIGPSGCGKSTFLRSINRLNDLIPGCRVTGELNIAGKNVYDPDQDLVALRREIGLVFQKPNPFPRTIYENISYGPRLRGLRKRADMDALVEDCLRKAALWEETKNRLHTSALGLSGGQQQRLCIARALATRPKVLLMDEPCSALDPIATGKIEDLIGELKSIVTIVTVTHNMQQAARISDLTAFFYVGSLVEYDKTSVIFTNPTNKQTEDYVTGRFG